MPHTNPLVGLLLYVRGPSMLRTSLAETARARVHSRRLRMLVGAGLSVETALAVIARHEKRGRR